MPSPRPIPKGGHPSYTSLLSAPVAPPFLRLRRRVATRPVFAGTSRFSACLSRDPVEPLPGRYMSRFLSILNKLNKTSTQVQFLTDNIIVVMQCNRVTVLKHSFKFTVTSFRPEVDAVHAQHGAGQRRAVPELQVHGTVSGS